MTNATLPNTQSFWGEVKPVGVSGVLRSQETASSFTTRPGKWLIGFKDGEEQRYYRGDTNISPDQVNTVVYTPFGDSNKIQSMTRLPGDAKYELTTRYTYDAKGNLTTERVTGVQVAERTSTYSNFIDARYPARIQNALGHITTLGYDQRFGQQNRTTRDNRTTTMAYDAFGRERNRTDTDGVTFTTVRTFCSASSCPVYGNQRVAFKVSTSSAVSPASDRYYDILGRLIQQDTQSFDSSALTRTEYNYDRQGRLYLETAPFFVGEYKPFTTYHYDIQNRRTAIHRPDGSQTRTSYSALPASNQFKVRVEQDVFSNDGTLEETQVKESLYSVSGDLESTTDAVGTTDAVTTSYQYTGSGQMQSAIVNNDSATEATFSYDLAGYQRALTDPSVGTVGKTFNALGELVQQTDNLGQSTAYYYDTLGRMRFQEDAHGVAHWQYDPGNAQGALSRQRYIEGAVVQSGSVVGGQIVYDEAHIYNTAGKLQDKAFTVTAGGLSRQYQYHYAYDGQGRISSLTYPSGVSAHYAYNSRGYLHKITDGTQDLKVFGKKNARLQTEEAVFGNGVVTVKAYGRENGRLQGLLTAGASEIQDNSYRWRSNGTLESRQVYGAGNTPQKEVFAYDAHNRLETAETLINGTSRRTLTTRYDRLGNIEEKTSSLPGDAAVSGYQYGGLGHASPHAVSGASIDGTPYTLHYNPNGAITHYDAASGDDKWISWNARQLPTEIVVGTGQNTQSPTARDRFKYGPNGNRYYRESSWWDPSQQQLVTEKTFILEGYEDLLPGDDPDYRRIQKATIDSSVLHITATEHTGLTLATIEYLHRDHLGSVEKITDADGKLLTGATGTFAYDPFGARRESDWSGTLGAQSLTDLLAGQGLSTRRGFTNHEHLDRTGLIHMNGRIYDPALGRFLSPDPFVQAPNNSQSWNRYSYVVNNPLGLTDPSGYIYQREMEEVTVTGTRLESPWSNRFTLEFMYGDYFGDGSSSYYTEWYNHWEAQFSEEIQLWLEDTEKAKKVAQQESGFFGPNFTHGFHLSSSTINPFTSGGGSVDGHYNDQAFIDENGVTKQQYTYEGKGAGVDVGLSAELVLGFGEGAWRGAFNSINISAGVFSGSIYWSPGGGGWWGASFGPSLGLPGVAFEETIYIPLTPSN